MDINYCELKKDICKLKTKEGSCWCKLKAEIQVKKDNELAKY